MYTDIAVYGPPGAAFDDRGNVYFDHGDGIKEYVGPYRDYNGNITTPPGPPKDNDCCLGLAAAVASLSCCVCFDCFL